MNTVNNPPRPPARWALVLAFGLLYLSWGTTYLVIKIGVKDEQLPPSLFGGARVALAGLMLLGYLAVRGASLRLPQRDWPGLLVTSALLFVGGNGLITVAEKTVPSGMAAVLAATTPLWIALLEGFYPGGERVGVRGWLGLTLGLGGVLLLLTPKLHELHTEPAALLQDVGPLLVVGSAFCWSLGSLVSRYRRPRAAHLTVAAYQMFLGGSGLALVGLALGETEQLPHGVTGGAVGAFLYLLVVGSLVGFVAFNWLLGHATATQVGTYAYVNPVVAVLIGWLFDAEDLTGWIVGGIAVILVGVALVRSGPRHRPQVRSAVDQVPVEPVPCGAAEG